jgi:hypothetical protein
MKRLLMLVIASFSFLALQNSAANLISNTNYEKRKEIVKRCIIEAIWEQESAKGKGLKGDTGKFDIDKGDFQITPIMVREINRLTGKKYSLEDRFNHDKSEQMLIDYQNAINKEDWSLEKVARCWNGGTNGMNNPKTIKYYKQVKQKFHKIFSCQINSHSLLL